jgi:hypothetical protein
MATVSRNLPSNPHLDVPKEEARALLRDWRGKAADAVERIQGRHPKFQNFAF